jgi:hypothetical protein
VLLLPLGVILDVQEKIGIVKNLMANPQKATHRIVEAMTLQDGAPVTPLQDGVQQALPRDGVQWTPPQDGVPQTPRNLRFDAWITDCLLVSLGNEKHHNVSNPFNFMDMISLQGKTNIRVEPPPSYRSFFIARITFGNHSSPLGSARISSARLKYQSPPPLLTPLSPPA